ncbi:hypothetical protein ACJMK2_006757 [Sinanodonta woodiana]|uniref:Class II aldolase/adducin N-terminal domain-containing protein n=1 Tax=Sinanodonta woodiana TaxID=1069815 RepID=A0ABD3VXC5_SINWO
MTDSVPQVNGPFSPTEKFIDSIDPDDPEYVRQLRRPADIKEDVKQMEDRGRVSLILNSEAFRRELEEIINEQIQAGNYPASVIALQQITDLLAPHVKVNKGALSGGSCSAIPISDIKGVDGMSFSKMEKQLRCKVAACYRVIDLNGWTHGIYNHISARINQELEHFLINPFGLLYSEVTASSLVKVDMQGEVVDPGSTTLGINKAGFMLHSAIHQFRPDIRCIIHLHTPAAVAVSVMKYGLLPLSQEALICGEVAYHDYSGILVDKAEREKLQNSLGPIKKVMFLRNHGVVACGASIEEAYHYAFNIMAACEAQVRAVPAGIDNIVLVSKDIQEKTFAVGSQGAGGVDSKGKKWKTGELEYEAIMRLLDNAGYRTGYIYKHPTLKQDVKRERANSEVEIPPSSSSFTYVFDGDVEHSKYVSPIKQAMERQKQQHKAGWLNSPNVYVKQEIDEIGTPKPQKITKWIKEDEGNEESPKKGGISFKVENPNLFAPQGSNPKEFKLKQKKLRKDYYEERVTAGPQSKILEGVTWEEAERMKLAESSFDGNLSTTGDSVIVIGAASKGIIQRDQQHNVQVYKSKYAANPFETMTEDEIERYKYEVEHRGESLKDSQYEEPVEPGPDGHLISTEERLQQTSLRTSQISSDAEPQDDVETPKHRSQRTSETPPTKTVEKEVEEEVFQPTATAVVTATSPSSTTKPSSPPSNSPSTDTPPPSTKSTIQRSESNRHPPRSPELIEELKSKNFERSKSERKPKEKGINGDEGTTRSPAKSDTLKSTDSASGGDTLDDRSSKEGSPTKEHPSPTKEKKKKKKFRMPSFSKTKKKDSKESAI